VALWIVGNVWCCSTLTAICYDVPFLPLNPKVEDEENATFLTRKFVQIRVQKILLHDFFSSGDWKTENAPTMI
jgi:hypothetical protein